METGTKIDLRRRLPDRRAGETREMMFRGGNYVVICSRFEDGGLAEVFINAEKVSTDAALCLSIGLQYGVPPDTIRKAVTRSSDGVPAGVIGAVLDMLAQDDPPLPATTPGSNA